MTDSVGPSRTTVTSGDQDPPQRVPPFVCALPCTKPTVKYGAHLDGCASGIHPTPEDMKDLHVLYGRMADVILAKNAPLEELPESDITTHRFDSSKLDQICLGNRYNSSFEMALKPTFKFTPKVHQLFGHQNFETVDKFSEFCYRFSSLTTLQMKWKPNITFTRLVSNLASLTQLTHLKLRLLIKEYPENPFALMDGDDEEARSRICLPQVKILELVFVNGTLHDFGSLSPLVFSSVEVIILKDFGCDICRLGPNTKHRQKMVKRCHLRLIRSPKNIFSNSFVRFFAKRGGQHFVDYTNHGFTQEDDQPAEIGAGNDDDQPKEEKKI